MERQPIIVKEAYRPPFLIRILLDYMVEKVNLGTEYGLKVTLVVENFRALFYLGFVCVLVMGFILTTEFVTLDHTAIIQDVFGLSNLCAYVDFPPATYVAPIVYIFPMIAMITYNAVSIFRISICYGERKISNLAKNSLTASHIYFSISVIWFLSVFEVHPDREKPLTMILHTIPYLNFKIALAIFQFSVVWFGTNIAWKDLEITLISRKTFFVLCWIHASLLVVTSIIGCIPLINGIGDMGPGELIGKGLWWDVHNTPQYVIKVMGVFGSSSPLGDLNMAIIIPFLQSMYLKSKSFGNISKTHTLIFYITDNKSVDE